MPQLKEAGVRFTGMSPDGKFVEMIEYSDHPWFVACQFHPEYKSRPLDPHPLFREFVASSYENLKSKRKSSQVESADVDSKN
jgi:CTP synthase